VKVVFTAHAVTRLRQILAFIAADSPANAVSMVERIIARTEIIYRVTADVVQVLTIMHERQLLPDEIP